MLKVTNQIFSLFNKKEQRQVRRLLGIVIIRSLVEVAGVASIMPFIAVASNPAVIATNPYLFYAYNKLGFQSTTTFLLALGLGVMFVLVFNNGLAAFTEWRLMRFINIRGHVLAQRLMARYLVKPYEFFLNRNSSFLGTNILTEVQNFMNGIVKPFVKFISKSIVSTFLLGLLLYIDYVLALIILTILGSAFGIVYYLTRRKLRKIGKLRYYHNRGRFASVTAAFSGIKDVKVKQCEKHYFDMFSYNSRQVALAQTNYQIVAELPKFALETVAFGGILLITLYFLARGDSTSGVIPLIAVYAMAGYRLMPALQSIFNSLATIRYNTTLLDRLVEDMGMTNYPYSKIDNWEIDKTAGIEIKDHLCIKNVSFTYPESEQPVLQAVNMHIKARTTIGLVGPTGSGKTTLVDVILGLLVPNKGRVEADNSVIGEDNITTWLRSIGYVPQQIFLSDDSIKNNIAFGIRIDRINEEAVRAAAKIADLHDFIETELPEGYDTIIGEQGVRLSGGQRQRIGIARALYYDPAILILDEATSSLDNVTERKVMKGITSLMKKKTIIIIAHRLTTIKNCDTIYFLYKGSVLNKGTYYELIEKCPEFKKLVYSKSDDSHFVA